MEVAKELSLIEEYKLKNPEVYDLFRSAFNHKSGVFVKLPTIKAKKLSSFSVQNSTKARPVFLPFPQEIDNQSINFTIFERGTGPKCKNPKHPSLKFEKKINWVCRIESCGFKYFDFNKRYTRVHMPHKCNHNLIIIDKEFGKKHFNTNRQTGKILGPKNRCHGELHFAKSCKDQRCKKAVQQYEKFFSSGLPRCEVHNGHDCCGIDSDGQIFEEREHISKILLFKYGSFCYSINDKKLKSETLKRTS